MLWLCLSLPQLPLEALRTREERTPTVVTACEGSTRWVVCCNEGAEHSHLQTPMNYTVALAVCPQVIVLERNVQAEHCALARLAAWGYQFSSTIILGEISPNPHRARHAALWLEIGASLKLFGGFRSLIEMLEKELALLSYTYRLVVGHT
jgi:protein ImuB